MVIEVLMPTRGLVGGLREALVRWEAYLRARLARARDQDEAQEEALGSTPWRVRACVSRVEQIDTTAVVIVEIVPEPRFSARQRHETPG